MRDIIGGVFITLDGVMQHGGQPDMNWPSGRTLRIAVEDSSNR
jgi:hypothetical protein